MSHDLGRRPAPAEVRSWDRSLIVLAEDLINAGLGQVEMLVEHRLPLTSQRVDAVLAGQHPQTGDPSYVVVELKQWSSAELWEDDPSLVLVDGYGRDAKVHPGAQVGRYCEYILDFTSALQDLRDPSAGVAYLHDATDTGVDDLKVRPQDRYSRLFTGQRRAAFIDFLRSRLDPAEQGAAAGDLLLNSAIAPSRQLLALAADEVQRRESFRLVGGQQLAYEMVLHAVTAAHRSNRKTAVIISGGPGSGKSVVALSLLGELARQGRSVMHATGSRSFTRTLRQVAGRRSPRTKALFKYFNQFMDVEPNSIDVLVLDEAHRIRETSADRWTRAQFRTGRPQTDGGPIPWAGDDHFDVRVADTPSEMELRLAQLLEEGFGARMAAGYCWPWSDPQEDGSLVPDVRIDGWSHPWNLRGERSVGGAPPAPLWATDPAGFGQVGCVYTAQGFEYDWNGVIFGPDLVWRRDRWVPIRAANKDPDFRNRSKVGDREFDHLIRNVYKVLLTRGMRGTLLYSTDEETRTFLHSLVPSHSRRSTRAPV